MTIKEVLSELGYSQILDNGREYRMRPLYRESSNNSSLSVKKDTGYFNDWGVGEKGSFQRLVQIHLKVTTIEASNWIRNKGLNQTRTNEDNKPKIKEARKFNKESLKHITPDHTYWVNRGVAEETISLFQGGIVDAGQLKNRYVFPIFNKQKEVIGYTGRDITDSSKIKWKHMGDKSQWKYPLQVNYKDIKSCNKVILLESIGDMLSLWSAGIKNSMVIFGVDISGEVFNQLLSFDPDKITISLNNDERQTGSIAAHKLKKKLLKFFDPSQVEVMLPRHHNDFGDMSTEEVKDFFND